MLSYSRGSPKMLKSLSSSCSFIDLQILFAFLPPQVKGVWELNGMKAPIKAAGGTSLRGLGCPLRAGVRAWGPGRSFDTAPPPLHGTLVIIIRFSPSPRWHRRRRLAGPSVSQKKPHRCWGAPAGETVVSARGSRVGGAG